MLIEVKDLRVGDEILVPSASSFRYYRVVRPVKPRIDKKTKQPIGTYKAVWVSTNLEERTVSQTYGGRIHNFVSKVYKCLPDGHNKEMHVNLNYKAIWLLKRELL